MNQQRGNIVDKIDWVIIAIYLGMVFMGMLNIYASVYDEELKVSMFSLTLNSGKQLLWIGTSIILIIGIMLMDYKIFDSFAFVIYIGVMLLLVGVVLFGREVAGSKSWFEIGSFRLQPSELAKFATALAMAAYLGNINVRLTKIKSQLLSLLIFLTPMLLIMLQPDAGSALVFLAFMIVLYREGFPKNVYIIGLSGIFLFVLTLLVENDIYLMVGVIVVGLLLAVIGSKTIKRIATIIIGVVCIIGVIISVDIVLNDVLLPHQQLRIKVLVNPDIDPTGAGWNITQSKIAIGSGGFIGKGFLDGTQTKFDFVPEQSTDFIFCTIGEEHGWIGSLVIIASFIALILRILFLAERQKAKFSRVYGYSVASIIFIHFIVNIGMTIGLVPVVGIPLPFFSYGGSSLWGFTVLLFILVKLDAHRMQVLEGH